MRYFFLVTSFSHISGLFRITKEAPPEPASRLFLSVLSITSCLSGCMLPLTFRSLSPVHKPWVCPYFLQIGVQPNFPVLPSFLSWSPQPKPDWSSCCVWDTHCTSHLCAFALTLCLERCSSSLFFKITFSSWTWLLTTASLYFTPVVCTVSPEHLVVLICPLFCF